MRLVLLDKNQKVFANLRDCLNASETQEINSAMQLFIEFKLDKSTIKKLEKCFFIGVPARYDRDNKFHLYRITSLKINETISVEGIEEAFDDLKGRKIVKDKKFSNQPIQKPLEAIFEDTKWTLDNRSTSRGSINFYYDSQLDCFSKLKDAYDFEVRFLYEFEGANISNKIVEIRNRIGKDRQERFVYGRDVVSVGREQNMADYYTAIVGRGNEDETGYKITFEDIEWQKSKGYPLNKEKGQSFLELPEATKVWGYPDNTPRIKVVDFDVDDKYQLINLSYQSLLKNCVPKENLNATINYDGKLMLGDTITVVRHNPKIVFKARIIKVMRNILAPELTVIEIGQKTFSTQAEREQKNNKDFQTAIHKINKADKKIDEVKSESLSQLEKQREDFEKQIQESSNETKKALLEQQKSATEYQIKIQKSVDQTRNDIQNHLSQRNSDIITLLGEDNRPIPGLPPIKAIESTNGMKINSEGFTYGGNLLGDRYGRFSATNIFSNKLKSVTIDSGTINGGTVQGNVYVSSSGGRYSTVMSTDEGVSVSNGRTSVAITADSITINGIQLETRDGHIFFGGGKVPFWNDIKNIMKE